LLRKAFKNEHDQSDLVTTVPKLGYRLDADVSPVDLTNNPIKRELRDLHAKSETDPPAKRIWFARTVVAFMVGIVAISSWFIFTLVGSDPTDTASFTLVPDKSAASLAVLPIEGLGLNEESSFLADGMTRDLTALLARVPNLNVAPYSSSKNFKDDTYTLREIAAELNVVYLVSGSLSQVNNRLIFRLSLADSASGSEVWSNKFEYPVAELYDLQEKVVQDLATSIFSELQAFEIRSIESRPVFDLTTYELLQKAASEQEVYDKAARLRSIDYLNQALAEAPENSIVLGALAVELTQGLASGFSDNPRQDLQLAMGYIQKARRMDPREPQVLMAAGITQFMIGETVESERLLAMSLKIDPNEAHAAAALGLTKCYLRDTDEGLALISHSEAFAPNHPRYFIWAYYRGVCLAIKDRYADSAAAYQEAIDRNPNYFHPYIAMAANYCVLGDRKTAQEYYHRAQTLNPSLTAQAWMTNTDLTKYPGSAKYRPDQLQQIVSDCLGS